MKSYLEQLTPEEYQRAFQRLFGDDEKAADESYLELRRGLALFFTRRRALYPDSLVDEVMDRLFRKAADGVEVKSTPRYAHRVAQFVLLELERAPDLASIASIADVRGADWLDQVEEQKNLELLDYQLRKGLAELSETDRSLVIGYFTASGIGLAKQRKALAAKFGMTLNALRVHVHRILKRLKRKLVEGLANQEKLL